MGFGTLQLIFVAEADVRYKYYLNDHYAARSTSNTMGR